MTDVSAAQAGSRRDGIGAWDARTYDRVAVPQERWGLRVLERLALQGGEVVLDAGCGSGRVTEHLLRRLPGGRVVALDADANMLDQARRRLAGFGERVGFVQADLSRPLPVSDAFDALISTATFHWVHEHDALFRNLAGVLRPGAHLEAQCGGAGNIAALGRAVERCGVTFAGPWRFATAEATEACLAGAGFRQSRCWLEEELTDFEDDQTFEDFLATVCLRPFQQQLGGRYREWVGQVAATLGSRCLDYVRLNISAIRS